jgi:hypothetical protein
MFDDRKFAWDFGFPSLNVLVEIQGGQFIIKSGHRSAAGLDRDACKNNLAMENGHHVFYFTSSMVAENLGFESLLKCLLKRMGPTYLAHQKTP